MTEQQPRAPYIEDGWLCEPCEPDYAPGISQAIPGSWSKPIVNLAELDGYDELIATAEQRGAVKAWRSGYVHGVHDERLRKQIGVPGEPNRANPYVTNNCTDQEGDDE